MNEKSYLRETCIARRDFITAESHDAYSFAVCERLVTYLSGIDLTGKVVALYNPIRSELDITPVLHALYAENISVALPVVESGRPFLSFCRFHSTVAMEPGAYGIYEPQGAEELTPDIVIVPLVAFDRVGHRIGYGKGFYDATLTLLRAENPALLAIGVAFALQEAESLPAEAHDAKLDIIITEKETVRVDA